MGPSVSPLTLATAGLLSSDWWCVAHSITWRIYKVVSLQQPSCAWSCLSNITVIMLYVAALRALPVLFVCLSVRLPRIVQVPNFKKKQQKCANVLRAIVTDVSIFSLKRRRAKSPDNKNLRKLYRIWRTCSLARLRRRMWTRPNLCELSASEALERWPHIMLL